MSGINIKLKSGDSLLIRGPSGCGKTSLLRAGWALAVRQQRQSQPSAASRHPLPAATPVHGTGQPARRGLLSRHRQTASGANRSHEHLPLGLSG
ncbi:nSTAND1 domain-containing NTPase [Neisseria meningitidis]|uniref:nSTAND1 domain-containing NTPase n=1 Tax=Neisseria meningitidis TaxID=487 RepID=UPI0035D4D973